MFDGEIVKEKFPLKIFWDVDNFYPRHSPKQSSTESKTESKTKLDFFCLQKALKCHV